jgi:hypothetical protein
MLTSTCISEKGPPLLLLTGEPGQPSYCVLLSVELLTLSTSLGPFSRRPQPPLVLWPCHPQPPILYRTRAWIHTSISGIWGGQRRWPNSTHWPLRVSAPPGQNSHPVSITHACWSWAGHHPWGRAGGGNDLQGAHRRGTLGTWTAWR